MGNLCYKHSAPENRGTPLKKFAHDARKSASKLRESNVYAEENSVTANPIALAEASDREAIPRYTSDSYQKVLDYHISEILLTTIIFGIIVLIRLHH